MRTLMMRTATFLAACMLTAAAVAEVTPITVQGSIKAPGGGPVAGTHSMAFRIYDNAVGGAQLWEETHAGVAFGNGIYSATLGTSASLEGVFGAGLQRWLSVSLDGGAEFSPRQRIAATAYANYSHQAGTASDLDGVTSAGFALASHSHPRTIIFAGATGASTASNEFFPINGGFSTSSEARTRTPAITDMTVKKIALSKTGASAATLTLYVNGFPTALSVTVPNAAFYGSAAGSVSVAEGDNLSLRCTTGFADGISYSLMAE